MGSWARRTASAGALQLVSEPEGQLPSSPPPRTSPCLGDPSLGVSRAAGDRVRHADTGAFWTQQRAAAPEDRRPADSEKRIGKGDDGNKPAATGRKVANGEKRRLAPLDVLLARGNGDQRRVACLACVLTGVYGKAMREEGVVLDESGLQRIVQRVCSEAV